MPRLSRWSLGLALAALCGCGQESSGVPDTWFKPGDAGLLSADADAPGLDASPGAPDGSSASPDAGAPPDAGAACVETCPEPNGVAWECRTRFALGTNWAWHNFGADFGGISAWSQKGVSQDTAAFDADLAAVAAKDARVVRWWMFPRFFTDSISFGADGAPTGVGGTLVADVQKALALAEKHDVYLMLTLFSFDGFAPTKTEFGIEIPGLKPIVVDSAKRTKLFDKLIGPVADAVESSPYRRRMIAWDLINEPEWAMTGPSLYGGTAFEPNSDLEAVTHAQMETFLKELTTALRAHSSAQITIGSAAIKWGDAWTHVGVDFYQLHYYDWVYEWFPLSTATLASAGLSGKPVVMGEFPNAGLSAIPGKGLPARTASQFASDLWGAGYGGALSWAFNDSSFPWSSLDLKTFADQHPCETRF